MNKLDKKQIEFKIEKLNKIIQYNSEILKNTTSQFEKQFLPLQIQAIKRNITMLQYQLKKEKKQV